MGLSCTVSEIDGDFCRKSQIFPTLLYLTLPPREFSLEFCNGGSAYKTWAMPLPDVGKSLTKCAFISIQYQSVTDRQTDKQTDRQICHNNIALCMCMLTRDRNVQVMCMNSRHKFFWLSFLINFFPTYSAKFWLKLCWSHWWHYTSLYNLVGVGCARTDLWALPTGCWKK